MAGVTKVHGDSNLVVNVGDDLTKNANAVIINTGISSPLSAYSFQFVAGNIAGELSRGTNGTAGAVETLLNALAANASVLAYQVDVPVAANSQVSVLLERSSWTSAAAMQVALRATLAANIGANGPMTTTTMAVKNNGLKLA